MAKTNFKMCVTEAEPGCLELARQRASAKWRRVKKTGAVWI